MAYRLSIEQFVGHFRDAMESIETVPSQLHRKVLYAAALDPISRAAFGPRGKKDTHRDWIVRTLVELADWKEASHISLPQLQLLLRHKKRTRFRLYREVSKRLEQWPTGLYIPATDSPTRAELLKYAAPEDEDAMRQCQYVQLFYTYRSNLIHEYREPGYGTDWGRPRKKPFYTSSTFGPWELVFPVAFFADLFSRSLTGVEAHLLKNRQNPHYNFKFGSLWWAK